MLRLLDVGGMGEVWAARNELTQRNFAIKFLLPNLANRPEALERFVREAETAGRLRHPSIVDVYDVALSEDGRPYIVMELLSGESLEARLHSEGTLTPVRAATFIAQIAQALSLAHAAGVVHRDLSTANIFIARNVEGGAPLPKILDFGVSKTLGPESALRTQTGNGAVLGCPEYMSPEQAKGAETVDHRTDIWSLGVVLYECLTGAVPFRARNYNALMIAILTRSHRPLLEVAPAMDAELAAIVESCLVKDREKRLQSASELEAKLSSVARRLATEATEAGITPRRRATDRLYLGVKTAADRDPNANPDRVLPVGVRWVRAITAVRPRRMTVSIASALIGIAIGIAAGAKWTAATSKQPTLNGASSDLAVAAERSTK